MNTDELKKLLKGSTAVLILENGEPSLVILGYDSYKNLLSDRPGAEVDIPLRHIPNGNNVPAAQRENPDSNPSSTESRRGREGIEDSRQSQNNLGSGAFQHRIGEKEAELLEKINKQILSLKDEIEKEEKGATQDLP